jgi:hypothetical protein
MGRTHAFEGRTGKVRPGLARSRKAKRNAAGKTLWLSQSCFAHKAGDLPCVANLAPRTPRALFFTPRPVPVRDSSWCRGSHAQAMTTRVHLVKVRDYRVRLVLNVGRTAGNQRTA